MRILFYTLFLSTTLLLLKSCATIGSPSGGPSDTTAPTIKSMIPQNKSLNYNGKTIEIYYSEYIDANNADKEFVFVPSINKDNYKIEKGVKSVKIKFNKSLEPNTTYQLQFGQGIKDVNQGNVCKTKSLVFSTGPVIDTLSVTGKTINILTNENIDCFVGLYKTDSVVDIKTKEPYYFIKSEKGTFTINNIKDGNYELIAFTDNNKNRLFDKKEMIGFIDKQINPKTDTGVTLKLYKENLDTLKFISATDSKDGYVIKYNKGLKSVQISDNQIYKIENEKIIVLKGKEDSLNFKIDVMDSLGTKLSDNVSIRNKVKQVKNTNFLKTSNKNIGLPGTKMSYIIDRKIVKTNEKNIKIAVDGKALDNSILKWHIDSMYFIVPEYKDSLNIEFKKPSFISVLNDTLPTLKNKYLKNTESEYGLIAGKVETTEKFVLELLKDKIVKYTTTNSVFEAKYMEPGEYTIRIIYDTDGNGIWTQGDSRFKKMPEKVYINPNKVLLKANWELKDLLIKPE